MRILKFGLTACVFAMGLIACQSKIELEPKSEFALNLGALCEKTLTGAVVSDDPQDADWRGKVLTVGPIDCADISAIKMPLAVGDDTSRVWTLAVTDDDISLSHAHTLKDGSPDPVTGYGGTTKDQGTATRQDFPVDQYSIDVFNANGLTASVTNVWSMEIKPYEVFAYELNREGRHFRAEFPLKGIE